MELDLGAAIAWTLQLLISPLVIRSHIQEVRRWGERLQFLMIDLVRILPLAIGAILLRWIAAAAAATLIVSMVNGWVFLIEILR